MSIYKEHVMSAMSPQMSIAQIIFKIKLETKIYEHVLTYKCND